MPVADRVPLLEDGALRGGHLVLSPDRLQEWLAHVLGTPCRVEPRRLRYKPGTSVVLAFDLTSEHDATTTTLPCVASAWSDAAAAKVSKALRRLTSESHLAHDAARHVLVTTAAGDRSLPFLRRVGRPGGTERLLDRLGGDPQEHGARITTVRHNPGRRWVGTLERVDQPPLLLRAYDTAATTAYAATCYGSLGRAAAPTPRLVARSRSWSVLAVEWAEGVDLSAHPDQEVGWRAAGRALAALHEGTAGGLRHGDARAGQEAVTAAAGQVAALLPDLATDVLDVARTVAAELGSLPRPVRAVHGDFSADQVVVRPDGFVTIIDLDAAGLGAPEEDLGCLTASTTICAEDAGDPDQAARRLDDFRTAYEAGGQPVNERSVALHAVAHRLRKAADPFRECAPDWREQVTRRVHSTRVALDDLPATGRR